MLDVVSTLTLDVTSKRSDPPLNAAPSVKVSVSLMLTMDGGHGVVASSARSLAQPDAKFTVPPLMAIVVPM